jgi:hypothetical protein
LAIQDESTIKTALRVTIPKGWGWVLLCILLLIPFWGRSQTSIEIGRNEDPDKDIFTKEIVKSYQFFLLIDTLELPIRRVSDSLLLGPVLDSVTFEKIKNEDNVVVKFENENNCFITQLPNVFIESKFTGNNRTLKLCFHKASDNFGLKLKMLIVLKSIVHGRTYYLKNFQRIDVSFIDQKNRLAYPFVYYCDDYVHLFIETGKKPLF